MNVTKLFVYLGLFLFVSSCAPTLTPYTQRLHKENQWTDDELRRIQFYVSEDIVMRRQVSGGTSEIISGEIKIVDGREMEEIVIRRGTPGILVFHPKSERFGISFEEGGDEKYLVFGPNPKAGGRFVLLASEWKRREGEVTYDGRKYRVSSASAYSSLMVDLKKIRKTSVRSRTASGRKI